MKKFLSLSLAALLLLGLLAGCGARPPVSSDETTRSPADATEILQQRREEAEQYMRYMMSMLWQVDQPLTYSYKVNSGDIAIDRDNYICHLEPGKIYSGLPYTHGSGDAESFIHFGEFLDNGVLRMSNLTPDLLNGSGGVRKANNIARIGNDCADAVFAAWSRVSSSITFDNAANMTPKNGCIPVGNYKTVPDDADNYAITGDICKENGEEVMFEAYAQMQMADGLTVNTSSGAHAMLVFEVHTVRDGEQINPEESYVLIHDQTSSNYKKELTRLDDTVGQEVYVMGGVERKFTFRKLFKSGYLPVTCKEFIDPAPLPAETVTDSEEGLTLDEDSMFAGAFISNYRISDVTLEILDKDGAALQKTICCAGGTDRNIFLLSRFEAELEQQVLAGKINWAQLQRGQEYTCRFSCRLSTGLELTVREFTFTY